MQKASTESDEKQSSGKAADADQGHKNGRRKGRGLLGGDKVLRSKGGKGEGWEQDGKNSERRQSDVSLGSEVTDCELGNKQETGL